MPRLAVGYSLISGRRRRDVELPGQSPVVINKEGLVNHLLLLSVRALTVA